LLLATVALLSNHAAADDAETLAKLDEALTAAAGFEHGQNAGPLVQIEQIVFQLDPDSALRGAVEDRLIEALKSAATRDGKSFLCRQLRVAGTEKCIPQLETLLTDGEVADAARYALGSLEFDEASKALHRALNKTSGERQAGIINTLADRRYDAAAPDCVKLLASSDADVAASAARALGRLGGADAIRALKAARNATATPLAAEIDNALLNCAAQLAKEGNAEEAAAIYETFYAAGRPKQLRAAALRGLIMTRQDQAARRLVEAIGQDDQDLSHYAISLIQHVSGAEATSAFVGVLPSLPAEGQVLMLHALGARGDATAAESIAEATKNEDQGVRVAALEALGTAGNGTSVPVLLQAAASGGAEKEIARRSLLLLKGSEVNAQLIRGISEGDSGRLAEVIHALAGRGVTEAVGPLFRIAGDENPEIRREAISALGTLVGESDLSRLVQLVVASPDAQDQTALVEAAGRAFLRIGGRDHCADVVLAQLDRAPEESRTAMLLLLGKTAAEKAIGPLRAAWKGRDPAMREAAVQALSQWPDNRVADDLLEMVGSADRQELKELALQGYLRLAVQSEDPTATYLRAMQRVNQTNDKKLVLAGLGLSAESPEALRLSLEYLNDKSLQATAGLATLRIANRLRDRDEQLARTSLHKVLEVVDHEDVHQRAQEVLNEIDKYQDHILNWVGVGPFTEKGKDGSAVYQTAFAPEKEGVQDLDWQPITKGIGTWEINLEATYGGLDYCAAYVRTRVWSDTDRDALLELGSDDGVRVWWNGKLVFDQWNEGGVSPRQKRVPVKLAKGWNDVMLKIVDQQGGWVFCCRIRKPDGTALDGLKVELP